MRPASVFSSIQLLNSRGNPTLQVVMKLADVLNIDAAFLVFGIRYKD